MPHQAQAFPARREPIHQDGHRPAGTVRGHKCRHAPLLVPPFWHPPPRTASTLVAPATNAAQVRRTEHPLIHSSWWSTQRTATLRPPHRKPHTLDRTTNTDRPNTPKETKGLRRTERNTRLAPPPLGVARTAAPADQYTSLRALTPRHPLIPQLCPVSCCPFRHGRDARESAGADRTANGPPTTCAGVYGLPEAETTDLQQTQT